MKCEQQSILLFVYLNAKHISYDILGFPIKVSVNKCHIVIGGNNIAVD
jgi:hypothetical protein